MATAQSSLWGKIREELSCSVCLELFTRPKVLPCQHTFCQDCLLNWAKGKECFQCPKCHLWAGPPPEWIPNLPDSHLLKNLCDTIRYQATILEGTPKRPHFIHRCSYHPFEGLKMYCNQCLQAICIECLREVHGGHSTVNLKEVLEERVTKVQALIAEGRDILESYCSFIAVLRDTERHLEEQKQQTDDSIVQAYDHIVQKLKEAKREMLFKVEQRHRQNLDAIQSQREGVLADLFELSAACDTAEHRIDQRGMEILEHDVGLIHFVRKYRTKAAPSPVPTQVPVFHPTDITSGVQTLGQVTFQSLQSAVLQVAHRGEPSGNYGNVTQSHQHLLKRKTIGGRGLKEGKFTRPLGVAVSEEDYIFVADCGNQRIQVFTSQGTFVHSIATSLSSNNQRTIVKDFQVPPMKHTYEEMMSPHDVAIDGDGNLWVVGDTDTADFAVKYAKYTGRMLTKIELQKTKACRGIAVDNRRNCILVTQTVGMYLNQGVVLEFRPDGTLVKTVGGRQGMNYPQYITVDREGNILVSDHFSDCVYVFDSGGEFRFKFGDRESGGKYLRHPHGICTDSSGNIIVAGGKTGCLELFDRAGRFLTSIPTDSSRPCAVAVTQQGQLVVTDIQEDTVTIFDNYCIQLTQS